jgi:small subunit ribosomal protein S2
MAQQPTPTLRTLMEAGVHFGHASGHWHPKMKPYIFATRDKLHIIDLAKVQEQLVKVLPVLEERIRSGKTIILVGTKKQVSDRVKQIGEAAGVSYVNVRWPGGVLTNWIEIQRSIARMKRLEEFLASEDAIKTIKKERVMMESDLRRMHYKFGGLRDLTRKPDALFVIDPSEEHNAIKEAQHEGIEIFALADTNSDPGPVHHLIPANDEGPKSLKLILDMVEKALLDGRKAISLATSEEKPAEEPANETENA